MLPPSMENDGYRRRVVTRITGGVAHATSAVLATLDWTVHLMPPALTEALIGAIAPLHESPQDQAVWSNALTALARAIPCGQGALVERLGSAANSSLGLVAGTDPRFLGEYQREYHRIDPFASEGVIMRLHDLGRAALSNEVLADVELQRSAFYSEYLSRYGDLFHGVGGSFPIAEHSHAHIWLLRPRGQAFGEEDRRRMDVFLAHARAAMRQRRWLMRMERERDAALAWMDCWSDATFVLDAQGAVVIANLMAERLLRGGDVLALRNGRLRPPRSTDPDWLAPALAELIIASRSRGGEATRCLAVTGRPGSAPLHAVLTTLPEAQSRAVDGAPRVALILRNLRQALPHFEHEQLRDLFGFTAAESRVANALLAGQSVEDIARSGQVRRDTIRAHVKRMLAKTGTKRQSDLQKVLVKALPNLRSLQGTAPVEPI
jgi:DNA-binding CsgD family transcriptional regulator